MKEQRTGDAPFLPYSRHAIDAHDIAEVSRVLQGDWLTTGPEVGRFEQALAEYAGARYAVVCANGTAALHLAVLALGLSEGDAVATTPITFLATANCARFAGARVHFADIGEDTANLDPAQVAALLEQEGKTIKAVLPVHFGGHPADMEAFAALAAKHGCEIIEDGCHALGASYRTASGETVKVGGCRHSAMTVFSFHPVKGITTGEGGAITTNDPALHERLLLLRGHGMVREESGTKTFVNREAAFSEGLPNPWYYEMQALGYNYRISDFQCALGRSQLARHEGFLAHKTMLAAAYRKRIAASAVLAPLVRPLVVREGIRHGYHLFAVRIDFTAAGTGRAALMRALQARGIGSQVHYIPLHFQPYYQRHTGLAAGALPVAEAYYGQCLSLPLSPLMSEADVERVAAALEEIIGGAC